MGKMVEAIYTLIPIRCVCGVSVCVKFSKDYHEDQQKLRLFHPLLCFSSMVQMKVWAQVYFLSF